MKEWERESERERRHTVAWKHYDVEYDDDIHDNSYDVAVVVGNDILSI